MIGIQKSCIRSWQLELGEVENSDGMQDQLTENIEPEYLNVERASNLIGCRSVSSD